MATSDGIMQRLPSDLYVEALSATCPRPSLEGTICGLCPLVGIVQPPLGQNPSLVDTNRVIRANRKFE